MAHEELIYCVPGTRIQFIEERFPELPVVLVGDSFDDIDLDSTRMVVPLCHPTRNFRSLFVKYRHSRGFIGDTGTREQVKNYWIELVEVLEQVKYVHFIPVDTRLDKELLLDTVALFLKGQKIESPNVKNVAQSTGYVHLNNAIDFYNSKIRVNRSDTWLGN